MGFDPKSDVPIHFLGRPSSWFLDQIEVVISQHVEQVSVSKIRLDGPELTIETPRRDPLRPCRERDAVDQCVILLGLCLGHVFSGAVHFLFSQPIR